MNKASTYYSLLTICFCVCPVFGDFKLTILHFNDFHSHVLPSKGTKSCKLEDYDKCDGGVARLATLVKQERKGENVLLLNAGDTFQGTSWYSFLKWQPLSRFMNMLKPDVVALGNHEFDDGPTELTKFLASLSVPIVASNMDTANEPQIKPYIQPSVVIDVNGTKVGVIGFLTPDTKFMSSPGGVTFTKEEGRMTRQVRQLYKSGVKILIGLGHSGYRRDMDIATRVPLLDIIVGGHTHSVLASGAAPKGYSIEGPYPTLIKQASGRKILVVTAGSYAHFLGKIVLTFGDDGEIKSWEGQPLHVSKDVPSDIEVLNEIDDWLPKIEDKEVAEVGETYVYLDGSRPNCRKGECNMGNLFAEAFLDLGINPTADTWSTVSVGVFNGGGLRHDMMPGKITTKDIFLTHPYNNGIAVVYLPGWAVLNLLESSVERIDFSVKEFPGAFLQVSGLKVKYDLCAVPGARVTYAKILCNDCLIPKYENIVANNVYGVVMTDFMAVGGDTFKIQDEAVSINITGLKTNQVVENYIRKASPITTRVYERIVISRDGTYCPFEDGK